MSNKNDKKFALTFAGKFIKFINTEHFADLGQTLVDSVEELNDDSFFSSKYGALRKLITNNLSRATIERSALVEV